MIAADSLRTLGIGCEREDGFAHEAGSLLEASFHKACLTELNARLRQDEFEPPGQNLSAWVRLARIVQVDPATTSIEELVEEACAWAERVRVMERIRMRLVDCGPILGAQQNGSAASKRFSFKGNRDWENWGLGIDANNCWHLFHFDRSDGSWKRHNQVALKIPQSLPGDFAKGFVSGRGILAVVDAYSAWKRCNRGISVASMDRVKTPMSRLRESIKDAVASEGHRPEGLSIVWCRKDQLWRSRVRFGHALPASGGRVTFQPAW